MDGRTHLLAGVAVGAAIVYVEGKLGIELRWSDIWLVVGTSMGSLLPDIDIDSSMLGRVIPGWLFWEHRTVTHSLWFLLLIGLVGMLIHLDMGLVIGLCIGIGTHLVLDGMTPMGLPYLLYPFQKRKLLK